MAERPSYIWCQHHRGFCCHLLLPSDGLHALTYSTCTWPSTACTSASLGLLIPSDLLGQRQCWALVPLLWSGKGHRAFTDFTFSYFLIKQKLEEESTHAKQASSFLKEHRNGSHATYNAEMKEKKSSREREPRRTMLPPLRHGKRSAATIGPQPPCGRVQHSSLSMEGRLADSNSPTEIRGQRRCLLFAPRSWRNRNVILGTQLPLILLNWDRPLRMCFSIF